MISTPKGGGVTSTGDTNGSKNMNPTNPIQHEEKTPWLQVNKRRSSRSHTEGAIFRQQPLIGGESSNTNMEISLEEMKKRKKEQEEKKEGVKISKGDIPGERGSTVDTSSGHGSDSGNGSGSDSGNNGNDDGGAQDTDTDAKDDAKKIQEKEKDKKK